MLLQYRMRSHKIIPIELPRGAITTDLFSALIITSQQSCNGPSASAMEPKPTIALAWYHLAERAVASSAPTSHSTWARTLGPFRQLLSMWRALDTRTSGTHWVLCRRAKLTWRPSSGSRVSLLDLLEYHQIGASPHLALAQIPIAASATPPTGPTLQRITIGRSATISPGSEVNTPSTWASSTTRRLLARLEIRSPAVLFPFKPMPLRRLAPPELSSRERAPVSLISFLAICTSQLML